MKALIQKLKNIWSIDELKSKIIFTLLMLVIYRVGTFISLPGINSELLAGLQGQTKGNILSLINTFAGGAFARGTIFALGIMPYISASIFMQLFSIAIPSFQRLQKEGEEGRRKINQYTRLLTIAFTAVQAIGYLKAISSNAGNAQALLFKTMPDVMTEWQFMFINVFLLIAGTMFAMWIGEKITDKGLGNGVSLLIMVGIIARLPSAIISEFAFRSVKGGPILFLVEIVIWIAIVGLVILLTQGTRKISINYAKRVIGNKQYGGARQYLPIKILAAGVMPIIFAQAILFLPSTVASFYEQIPGWLQSLNNPYGLLHNVVLIIMIFLFTYFYTAIIFNPVQIAKDMKSNNGFIPGIKPGKQTADFVDDIISKITLPGAVFIAIIAIMPAIANVFLTKDQEFSQFFGGTSLLILIGVVLDTLQQIDSYLLVRKYDGLMSGGGKFKGRLMGNNPNQQVGF